jgi:hypothetical protein
MSLECTVRFGFGTVVLFFAKQIVKCNSEIEPSCCMLMP